MIAEIFEHTEEDDASTYMNEITVKKAADIISQLETDTAANILRLMSKEKRELLVDMTAPDVQKEIRLISSFDEDEIGSRMTANYICIRENITVPQAMQELVKQAADNDNISTIFVVDENDLFYGAIDLKELIIARKDTKLDDLIVTSFPYVYGNENVEDCIERLKDYSENSIPVLDNSNRLLGVITSQNIIEAVDDEMGDDYAKLAGLTAEEDLNEPLPQSIKKRIPWLLILLGLGMLVSGVVGVYEKVIAQLTIIMAFQSLILDMAGNVGTQSLAVTIRVLMDENLTGKAKGTPCRQGDAGRLLQRTAAGIDVDSVRRTVYMAVQTSDCRLFLPRFELYRRFDARRYAYLQRRRYADPDVLQEDKGRPCGRFGSADHDHQRPRCSSYLLYSQLGAAHSGVRPCKIGYDHDRCHIYLIE